MSAWGSSFGESWGEAWDSSGGLLQLLDRLNATASIADTVTNIRTTDALDGTAILTDTLEL